MHMDERAAKTRLPPPPPGEAAARGADGLVSQDGPIYARGTYNTKYNSCIGGERYLEVQVW